jgi:hypothetical protein
MAKRRNLKKEKQERNRAYARKFKKRKLRNDGRGEGAGNGATVVGCSDRPIAMRQLGILRDPLFCHCSGPPLA